MKRKVYKLLAGDINRLHISEEAYGHPGEGEVLVRVKSIGLNFADVFAILGLYSATPKGKFVPGLEYSGVVEATGNAVSEFKAGDRVMGVTRFGAYSSFISTSPEYLLPIPQSWNFEEGASFLVQVLTAYYGLIKLGDLTEGMNVLIHSGAGGVGIWANRICKAIGARTIGTVGSVEKLSTLDKEGFDHGLVRVPRTFEDDVRTILKGQRLDLIMECIGGKIMKSGWKLLSPMGRMVIYGSAHYGMNRDRPNYLKLLLKYIRRPKLDPQNMIAENKSFMAFNLIYLFEHSTLMKEMLKEIEALQMEKPLVGETYSFEELPQAIRFFYSGKSVGKVVINL